MKPVEDRRLLGPEALGVHEGAPVEPLVLVETADVGALGNVGLDRIDGIGHGILLRPALAVTRD